jgi:cytochrome b subunit of formate dehydrogenase/5-methylcytosine-specific restriction endonuclease McrA
MSGGSRSAKGSIWLAAHCIVIGLLVLGVSARAEHKIKDSDCLTCHGDSTLTADENGRQVSLFVDQDRLKHSFHGRLFGCVDCHTDVKSLVHEKPPAKISCSGCHEAAQQAYLRSVHARSAKQGAAPAAVCEDCHGGAHQILTPGDPASQVNHANIPRTCGRCHGQKFTVEPHGVSTQTYISYQESVHGRAIENGSQKAAVCTDCHGAHEILAANDQKSSIYKFNVPATCGKCHGEIQQAFMASIHGQGITRGNGLAPVCTDCHGIHSIKNHKDPSSPVAGQNLSLDTCARCHEGVRLSQEFGLPGNRVSSYLDSYHGLASEGGSVIAANCSSCHGVHNILPSSDPRSTINHANLDATCGQCHRGATQKFTLTRVHLDRGGQSRDVDSVAVRWVRLIYVPMIVLVIGAMFLHNLIIWRSKLAARRRAHAITVERMTLNQRWQHLILLSSFILLVITGFALKFPDSWFAHAVGMGENLRSLIHRMAGIVLISAGIYHIFYVVTVREGRRLLFDLAPRINDGFDVVAAMRYYLGLTRQKPRFGRFNYAEKAEYWALVWGTGLMGLTGVMLWGKVWVGNLLSRCWVDVATAIHYYEAILATLAIVVWHFYQVFFDPDVYPMNGAWLDGKMPVEHYREEHSLDTETLKAQSSDPESPAGSSGVPPSGVAPAD